MIAVCSIGHKPGTSKAKADTCILEHNEVESRSLAASLRVGGRRLDEDQVAQLKPHSNKAEVSSRGHPGVRGMRADMQNASTNHSQLIYTYVILLSIKGSHGSRPEALRGLAPSKNGFTGNTKKNHSLRHISCATTEEGSSQTEYILTRGCTVDLE